MKALAVSLMIAATPAPEIHHYAPAENLERIDVRLIDNAERSIDMAAYVLTDERVIEALRDAAERGVVVRIDRTQDDDNPYPPSKAYRALQATPGVSIHVKLSRVLMHLKSYCIDGTILRTGSANFSASGLTQQDNDLILFDDLALAARFEADFATVWRQGAPQIMETDPGGQLGTP